MKVILLLYVFLISQVLTSSDSDLERYGTIESTYSSVIFFDSSEFKIDEEIYIVITGVFDRDYIQYYFCDTIPPNVNTPAALSSYPLETVYSNKIESHNDNIETKYFTITKSRSKTRDGGKNLLIFPYMYGAYKIENTKDNKGTPTGLILGIVFGVLALVAIVAIIIWCYRRKKLAAQYNQGNTNVQVYNGNNGNNQNVYNNNPNNNQFNNDPNAYNNIPNNNQYNYNQNAYNNGFNNNPNNFNNGFNSNDNYNNYNNGYNNNPNNFNNNYNNNNFNYQQ